MSTVILEWEDGRVSRINGFPAEDASKEELLKVVEILGRDRAVALDMQARLIDNMVENTHQKAIHDLLIAIVDAIKTGELPAPRQDERRDMEDLQAGRHRARPGD